VWAGTAYPVKQVDPTTAERYRKVIDLKMAGLTFDRIAQEVGYKDRSGAKRAYDAALERWAIDTVEQQRIIQTERLDRLFYEAFNQAIASGDLQAIDRCLRIEKRRAELWGLDAPRQHEISGPGGAALAIRTDIGEVLMQKLAQLQNEEQEHPQLASSNGDGPPGGNGVIG